MIKKSQLVLLIISLTLIYCTQESDSSENKTVATYTDSISHLSDNDSSTVNKKETIDTSKLIKNSYYELISGSYDFGEDFKKKLPSNAKEYFVSLDFPYYLNKSLMLNYYSKRLPFKLEDFFIFNSLNSYSGCEYIALIDTSDFIEVIAQQCKDMEMWVSLYVFDNSYNILDSELLLLSGGGLDEEPEEYNNYKIEKLGDLDSLEYRHKRYIVKLNEVYIITDSLGNKKEEVGYQKNKVLTVSKKGRIQVKDSLMIKKEYVKYHRNL